MFCLRNKIFDSRPLYEVVQILSLPGGSPDFKVFFSNKISIKSKTLNIAFLNCTLVIPCKCQPETLPIWSSFWQFTTLRALPIFTSCCHKSSKVPMVVACSPWQAGSVEWPTLTWNFFFLNLEKMKADFLICFMYSIYCSQIEMFFIFCIVCLRYFYNEVYKWMNSIVIFFFDKRYSVNLTVVEKRTLNYLILFYNTLVYFGNL